MIKNLDILKNKIKQNVSDLFPGRPILEAADLLITTRTKPEYLLLTVQPKKYWGKTDFINLRLVGGKIEKGEGIIEALTREVQEEIGIIITRKNLFSFKKSNLIIIKNKRVVYREELEPVDPREKNPQIIFSLPFPELLPKQSNNKVISELVAVGYIFSGQFSWRQVKSIKFKNEVPALLMVPLDKINLLFNSKKPTLKRMLKEGSKIIGDDIDLDVQKKLWVVLPKNVVDFIGQLPVARIIAQK